MTKPQIRQRPREAGVINNIRLGGRANFSSDTTADQEKNDTKREDFRASAKTLAHESLVVLVAARQMLKDKPLDWNDYVRLVHAENRIATLAKEMQQ